MNQGRLQTRSRRQARRWIFAGFGGPYRVDGTVCSAVDARAACGMPHGSSTCMAISPVSVVTQRKTWQPTWAPCASAAA